MANNLIFALLFAAAAAPGAGAETSAPADTGRDLQVGGSGALDQHSRLDAKEDPRVDLSDVALGANVALAGGIEAAVVLKAEEDLAVIFFDQATATLTPPESRWTLIAGQQTYNHGLLTTRLVSDPEILPLMEVKQPGLSAVWAPGDLSAGVGLVLLETGEGDGTSRDYAAMPNLDWNHGPWQARLSGMVSRFRSDIGLAATLAAGPVTLDAEGFSRLRAWDGADRSAGYSLGAQYALTTDLAAAMRHDGIAPEAGKAPSSWRVGGGLSLTFRRDLFAAAEYSYGSGVEEPGHRLALRAGLKSTLHLPGFQRETLTQP